MTLNSDPNSNVRDPYKNHQQFEKWEKNGKKIQAYTGRGHLRKSVALSAKNIKTIQEYIEDMSLGRNTGGNVRGERSPSRLLTIKSRMQVLARIFEEHARKDLLDTSEGDLLRIFKQLRQGKIVGGQGRPYKSVADYAIQFKAFWHWYQRKARKAGNPVDDITFDLDTSKEKPNFVYLALNDIEKMANAANGYYRVLIWFLFDTGIRTGGELLNVRKKDLAYDEDKGYYVLHIRDEASKTFGRDIKLLLATKYLKDFLEPLKPNENLFSKNPIKLNQYLRRLSVRVFGAAPNKKPKAKPYNQLRMYDFRHSSACYWVVRYTNRSSLLYRFGWSSEKMINYYTDFLGMKDTISQEDLIDADQKGTLEKELTASNQRNALMEEQMNAMQDQLSELVSKMGLVDKALVAYKDRTQQP